MKVAIYCRVSRKDLNLENQLTPCERRAKSEGWDYQIYTEKESSRNTRPVKEELLKQLRNRVFEGVLVYSLDRWCRSVSEFAFELDEFRKRKIGFYSLREGFAFDTAMGQAMAQMAMVFAQLERDLIRERTIAGLITATAKGKIKGRHPIGCGCGWSSQDGKIIHNGKVKPIRNEHNNIVGWEGWDERNSLKLRARERAKEKPLKEKCEICGSIEKLERHHLDYNKKTEFMTLCRICHLKQTPSVQPLTFSEVMEKSKQSPVYLNDASLNKNEAIL